MIRLEVSVTLCFCLRRVVARVDGWPLLHHIRVFNQALHCSQQLFRSIDDQSVVSWWQILEINRHRSEMKVVNAASTYVLCFRSCSSSDRKSTRLNSSN